MMQYFKHPIGGKIGTSSPCSKHGPFGMSYCTKSLYNTFLCYVLLTSIYLPTWFSTVTTDWSMMHRYNKRSRLYANMLLSIYIKTRNFQNYYMELMSPPDEWQADALPQLALFSLAWGRGWKEYKTYQEFMPIFHCVFIIVFYFDI